MKFLILLPAALALGGAHGSPVSPTSNTLAKLSTNLHDTTTYLRQIEEHPSGDLIIASSQFAQGLAYIQNILNDIGSFEINTQVRSFVIPEIQKALQNQINQLESSNSKTTTKEIEITINLLSKSVDHVTSLVDTSRASVCGGGNVTKKCRYKYYLWIAAATFRDFVPRLLNLNGLGSLIFNLAFVLGCPLRLF